MNSLLIFEPYLTTLLQSRHLFENISGELTFRLFNISMSNYFKKIACNFIYCFGEMQNENNKLL